MTRALEDRSRQQSLVNLRHVPKPYYDMLTVFIPPVL